MARPPVWKGGDGWLIDGFGPDGVSARVLDVTRNVVRLQTGYLYHYAFAMLIGAAAFITWFMFAAVHMMNWPILSVVTFLPVLGALLVMLLARGNGRSRRHRALDRAVDDAGHLRHFAGDGVALRSDFGRNSSSSKNIPGSASPRITWASTAFRCPS